MAKERKEELAEGITLLMGDSLELMPALGKVDHVIADCPYENELHAAVGKINRIRNDGHRTRDDLGFAGINSQRAEIAKALVEISNGWALIFTLAEGVRAWRDDLQAVGAKWDTVLAFVKPDASPRFNGQGAARGFECCVSVWCGTGYRSWNGGGKRGVYTHCVNTGREQDSHPTAKPIPLMMELVADFTNHGQLVLDPFMGCGSTGIACVKLGRRFTGIECEPKYFDAACRRINEAIRQTDLFVEMPKAKQVKFW